MHGASTESVKGGKPPYRQRRKTVVVRIPLFTIGTEQNLSIYRDFRNRLSLLWTCCRCYPRLLRTVIRALEERVPLVNVNPRNEAKLPVEVGYDDPLAGGGDQVCLVCLGGQSDEV